MPELLEVEEVRASPVGETVLPEMQKPEPFRVEMRPRTPISLPREILFAASSDRRLRFKQPITLNLSREREGYVAYAADIEEFGCGDDVAQALDDFGKTISELYFSLSASKDRLSPHLQGQFARLNEFLDVRHSA